MEDMVKFIPKKQIRKEGYSPNYNTKYHTELRNKVLHLFEDKCVQCGFSDKRALQIDHINGGGAKEVKKLGSHRMLKDIIKDPTNYQILCANCNWIKRHEKREVRKMRCEYTMPSASSYNHYNFKINRKIKKSTS